MKKLISLLMVVVLLASVCVINASAALRPKRMGDLNDDYNVDITDVTLIQSILAQLNDRTPEFEYLGDVNSDDTLNIYDATAIQLWLAQLISDEDIDIDYFSPDVYLHDANPDYESGKAMVGVPVTFTMNAVSGVQPLTYSLYVSSDCVATSTENTITYTFDKAGTYYVEIDAENVFSNAGGISYLRYEVVEPYDYVGPEITSSYITGKHVGTVIYGQDGMRAYAEVKGGVSPYQYKFELTRPKTCENDSETVTITQDFSDKNYIELEKIYYDDFCNGRYHTTCTVDCTLNITVKDANGVEATKTMEFEYSNNYPI